jgi:lipoprotein-anchoring transpeptidase ErfK/SrfK
MRALSVLLLAALLSGCVINDDDDANPAEERQGNNDGNVATVLASGSDRLSQEELERGRLVMDWREWVDRDTSATGDTSGTRDSVAATDTTGRAMRGPAVTDTAASPASNERWDDITPEAVNRGPIALPLFGDVAGASVVRVQLVLDRAAFSPGVIDGRWGRNTEKAVFWLQRREGLPATGRVDQQTWERLVQLAGQPTELVRQHRLTEDDVKGPFVQLPEEFYERRNLECQCYESLGEKLAERFHTTEDLLRKLNQGVDLNGVTAGQMLNVPAVERTVGAGGGEVARIVVSDGGGYVQALDASNRLLYHFPATLGSDYSPSPSGDYRITNIARDPTWHYQPALLENVPDDEPDAVLPAGPNNAVGTVWMQLSKEHYGIHGTSTPETIGYTTSNGCVRLTNWDAEFLSQRVKPNTPVTFRDIRG